MSSDSELTRSDRRRLEKIVKRIVDRAPEASTTAVEKTAGRVVNDSDWLRSGGMREHIRVQNTIRQDDHPEVTQGDSGQEIQESFRQSVVDWSKRQALRELRRIEYRDDVTEVNRDRLFE